MNWGPDWKILLYIYNSCIRWKLDYGSVICYTSSKSTQNKLNTIQIQVILISQGAYWTSPIMSLSRTRHSALAVRTHLFYSELCYYARHSDPTHPKNYKLLYSKISNKRTIDNRNRTLMKHLQISLPDILQPLVIELLQQKK